MIAIPGFVPGSPFVAGVDAVLDVAETFAGGTGEHMGKPERDLLLAPDIAPALPGQSSKKAATEGKASKTPYTQDVYRGHTRPVVFLDVLPDSGSLLSVDADGLMCLWSAFRGKRRSRRVRVVLAHGHLAPPRGGHRAGPVRVPGGGERRRW